MSTVNYTWRSITNNQQQIIQDVQLLSWWAGFHPSITALLIMLSWNPCPLQWNPGVLTTGLPGKSLLAFLRNSLFVYFEILTLVKGMGQFEMGASCLIAIYLLLSFPSAFKCCPGFLEDCILHSFILGVEVVCL